MASSPSIMLSTNMNCFATLAEPTATQATGDLPVSGPPTASSPNMLQLVSVEAALALLPYEAGPPLVPPPSGPGNNGEMPIQVDPTPDQPTQPGPSGQDIEMREQ
jgi:hypothetical protein